MRRYRSILTSIFIAGCATTAEPLTVRTEPSPEHVPSACEARISVAAKRAGAHRDQGLLISAIEEMDAALRECPTGNEEALALREDLNVSLHPPGAPSRLELVSAGWVAFHAGSTKESNALFSRALAAKPTPDVVEPAVVEIIGPIARLDDTTIVAGALRLRESGVVFIDLRRGADGVAASILRFVEIPAEHIVGGDHAVVVASEQGSRLFRAADAEGIALPGARQVKFVDQGKALFLGSQSGAGVFEVASGAPRGPWVAANLGHREARLSSDGARVVLCEGDGEKDVLVLSTADGAKVAHVPIAENAQCRFDEARAKIHIVSSDPAPKRETNDVRLRTFDIQTGARIREKVLTRSWDIHPWPQLVAATGELTVSVKDETRRRIRVDAPQPAKSAKKADSLPRSIASTDADLSFLRHLAQPPREILGPYFGNVHTWIANGVLSPNGKTIAVLDDFQKGPEESENGLLFIDAETLKVQKRVDVGSLRGPWIMVEFIDDEFATVRAEWDILIVHAPSGTIRARTYSDRFVDGRLVTSLGQGFAATGGELYDLGTARSFEETRNGFAGTTPTGLIEIVSSPSTLQWSSSKAGEAYEDDKQRKVGFRNGALELEGERAPWVLCDAGGWLMPFDVCASWLGTKAPPP